MYVVVVLFHATTTTEINTLSLHDALPIYPGHYGKGSVIEGLDAASALDGVEIFHAGTKADGGHITANGRSEEHTSELQSRPHLVCRLLLEKKNKRASCSPLPRR